MTNKVTDFPEQTDPTEDALLYLVQSGNDNRLKLGTLHDMPVNGFADYNHAGATVSLTPDTFAAIPNDGLGPFTNLGYLPKDATDLMDTATGKIDCTSLGLGDLLIIRNDFEITPSINDAAVEFRYTLGSGGNAYTLTQQLGRLDRGAGIPYRFSLKPDFIYMGDLNTKDNPIGLEISCTGAATVSNAGIAIGVVKR